MMNEIKLTALLVAVALLGSAALFWIFPSYMEARAYNRITGKNVSTWDAMWVDLRVQSEAK